MIFFNNLLNKKPHDLERCIVPTPSSVVVGVYLEEKDLFYVDGNFYNTRYWIEYPSYSPDDPVQEPVEATTQTTVKDKNEQQVFGFAGMS